MKNKTGRMIAFMAVVCSLLMTSCNHLTQTGGNKEPQTTYGLATVKYQGQDFEVPMIMKTGMSGSGQGMVTTETCVFVPDFTEESLQKNKEYVKQIKDTGECEVISQEGLNPDFGIRGCIAYHSTLSYSTVWRDDAWYYDLAAFKLEREIYTQAPFADFYNASATAVQVGPTRNSNEITSEEKEYGEIEYDKTYGVPQEWEAVSRIDDISRSGVKYVIRHLYSDGTEISLEYFHKM